MLAEPNIAEELTILNLDQVDQVVGGEGEPSWGGRCHLGGEAFYSFEELHRVKSCMHVHLRQLY